MPSETISCQTRQLTHLGNPLIQKLRRAKDKAYTKGKPTYAYLHKTLELFIAKAKKRYYDQKLNSLKAGSGNWWKSLKSLDKNANTKTQKYYSIDGKLSSPQLVNQVNDYNVNISDASAGNRMTPHTSAWLPTNNEVSICQKHSQIQYLRQTAFSAGCLGEMSKVCIDYCSAHIREEICTLNCDSSPFLSAVGGD